MSALPVESSGTALPGVDLTVRFVKRCEQLRALPIVKGAQAESPGEYPTFQNFFFLAAGRPLIASSISVTVLMREV